MQGRSAADGPRDARGSSGNPGASRRLSRLAIGSGLGRGLVLSTPKGFIRQGWILRVSAIKAATRFHSDVKAGERASVEFAQ